MRPLEFYRLAVAIAPSAVSEPVQRTVIGRLYYGLHHEARCRFYRENPNADPLGAKQQARLVVEALKSTNQSESGKGGKPPAATEESPYSSGLQFGPYAHQQKTCHCDADIEYR